MPSADLADGGLTAVEGGFLYAFCAMASPCEVRVDSRDADLALRLGAIARAEAARIETKYSRYRPDSFLSRINTSGGKPVKLDPETCMLIDYAAAFHALSDGLFDITSGVLRRIWRFDGSDRVPDQRAIDAVMPLIGWDKVVWRKPYLTLPPGMEIDFGGLGKEYAVDRALLDLVAAASGAPVLVNFGGDLRVSGPRAGGGAWRVAMESVERPGFSEGLLEMKNGALTTSGDARRYLLKDGVRYSHILDPRTGWPVKDPPRAVTVAAPTCLQAGLTSTLAMLKGAEAEDFLRGEGVEAWWRR